MGDEFEEDEEEVEEGAPAWMATFADMATLLLTFFVLLLSFANMDVTNFREALGSVREALGVQFKHPGDMVGLTTSVVELSKEESVPNSVPIELRLKQRISAILEGTGLGSSMEVSSEENGIALRVTDRLLFADGEADLLPGAERIMKVVGQIAREIELPLWIEGHTDDRPIRTVRFPSNWELSVARSLAALHHLTAKEALPSTRLRIGGYADSHPLASNETEAGRGRNRRVEFLFLRPRDGDQEAWRRLSERLDALGAEAPPKARQPNAPEFGFVVPAPVVEETPTKPRSRKSSTDAPLRPFEGPAPFPLSTQTVRPLKITRPSVDSSGRRIEELLPESLRDLTVTERSSDETRRSRRVRRRR
jgi:chemotaxis protein MotB